MFSLGFMSECVFWSILEACFLTIDHSVKCIPGKSSTCLGVVHILKELVLVLHD